MIYNNTIDDRTTKELIDVSNTMFRKNFFGIFHGAISTKLDDSKFIINTKNAIFDNITSNDFVILSHKQDYGWQEASMDTFIHSFIYKEINEAKYIAYTLPPFSVAYSLYNEKIIPKDYFGYKKFKEIKIYNPKEYDSWYERADVEICNFLKQHKINFIVVKGYGIYIYERDICQLAKTVALIENSARILLLSQSYKLIDTGMIRNIESFDYKI